MLTIRAMAASATIFAGVMIGVPTLAFACNDLYPWTCSKPAGSESSGSTTASEKAGSKPAQVAPGKRAASKKTAAKRTSARSSARNHRTRTARRSKSSRAVVSRERSAPAADSVVADRSAKSLSAAPSEEIEKPAPSRRAAGRSIKVVPTAANDEAEKPSAPSRRIDANRVPESKEPEAKLAPQADPSLSAAEPLTTTSPQVAAIAASALPVKIASQHEVNEIDLAAARQPAPADTSWLAQLFLALGGLLAVGSALRLMMG